MKHLPKILMAAFLFSVSAVFHVSAEEVKTSKASSTVVSEGVSVALPDVNAPDAKTTLDNLQTAFNGESNAHARYLAFAKRADVEGYGKVASLFRAAAKAEQIHLQRHAKEIKALKGIPAATIETPVVKSTKENLEAAVKGETYESTVMYPEFLAQAKKDNNKGAIEGFEDATMAEAVHAGLYKQALENLDAWKGKNTDFYVCPVCGNVTEKISFKACPICGTSGKRFVTVK